MDKNSINSVYRILAKKIGEPKTELNYRNPYTFLVSVVLSAQATDKSVNNATKDVFKVVKTPKDMVTLGERKLRSYIKTIGLYNSKARNVINLSKILIKILKKVINSTLSCKFIKMAFMISTKSGVVIGHLSRALSLLSAAAWFLIAQTNMRLSRRRQLVSSDCVANIDNFVLVEAINFGFLFQL